MLEQMRKGSKHPIVKMLFFILALSFVVWGVGDVFRNNTGSAYIATVGKTGISAVEVDNMVRSEAARYQEATGKSLSEEDLDRMGVKRYVIGQLIRDKLITTSAADIGIVAGKKIIANHIYSNEAFFDEKGKFDKERFQSILHANGLSEEKYIKSITKEIAVNNLMETMTAESIVPDVVAKNIFSFQNESRIADLITLPADSISSVPEPSETDLVKYYKDNQDNFAVPELRGLTYVTFNINKIKSGIKLTEDELKNEYQRSIQQYKTEEARNVEQYLFNTEDEAKAAFAKISKGDTKSFAGNKIELGSITKSNAPAEVKDAIFSLKKGEVSQPVKSSLGWHILIVKSIDAEKVKSFNEVKGDIEKDMLTSKASDEFSKFGNQVEDEFAAGKTMEEVAKKFDLTNHKVAAIDANGNAANGSKVTDMADPEVLLPIAFNLDAGAHSSLTLLSDNASYAIIRVDTITPKRIKALDEVKGLAITKWKEQEKIKLLKEKATQLALQIKAGEDIKSLAAKMKLKISTAQNIKRPNAKSVLDGKSGEPLMLATELFTFKKEGDVTGAYRNVSGDFVIAKLKTIVKTNPENDKNGYKNLKSELEEEMRDDLMGQYMNYLRNKYPVSIKMDLGGGK